MKQIKRLCFGMVRIGKKEDLKLDLLFIDAGTPAIVQFPSGNDLLTTEFAPILVLSPITIGPNNLAPGPI